MVAPMRNPSSNPCFTQEFTFHLPSALFSAARTSPRLSACLNSSKTVLSSRENSPLSRAANASICSRNGMRRFLQQPEFAQELTHAIARLFLHRHERQTKILFEQAHQRHRSFNRSRTRFDKVT